VFNRTLTEEDVQQLFGLVKGVGELR